jgi:electron transfer flavoprotein beta subunit
MKIAVLIKHVPDTESRLALSDDRASINFSQASWVINPFDEIALEQAVQLKEAGGGEVIVVSCGPAFAEKGLRDAFAVGADRGILVDTGGAELDPLATAEALAAALKNESCDIVFAGRKSTDVEAGIVHIAVAEYLAIPHASPVEKFEMSGEKCAHVTRVAGGSTKEIIDVDLPALIGCEKGLCEPRYPTLPGKMKAKAKPVDVRPAGISGDIVISTRSYSPAPDRGAVKMIDGSPEEAAKKLIDALGRENLI